MDNALTEELFGALGRKLRLPTYHDEKAGTLIHQGNRTSIRLLETGEQNLAVEKRLLRFCNVEEERRGLAREAELQNWIPHPNVVPVLDYGEDRLCRPYIRGLTLAQLLDWVEILGVPVKKETVMSWLKQLAQLLQVLHQGALPGCDSEAQPIVHRDLTPGNLYLDHSGALLLSDFGLARRTMDSALAEDERLQGTPNFLPPEMHAFSCELAPANDIYQMSLLAACLLSPQLYQTRRSIVPPASAEIHRAVASTWHDSARAALCGYSFREGLSPQPSARPSAEEFLKLLEHPLDA